MFSKHYSITNTALLIIWVVLVFPTLANAQCKGFAEKTVKEQLDPYIHDGNLSAMLMAEDQTITISKDFYASQEYRMVVMGSPNLPKIEFEVIQSVDSTTYTPEGRKKMVTNHTVIYTNKDEFYQPTWEFVPQHSTTLNIKVRVPRHKDTEARDIYGCVAVLFGFKMVDDSDE